LRNFTQIQNLKLHIFYSTKFSSNKFNKRQQDRTNQEIFIILKKEN
jgi:hypothetical protein